MSKRLERLPSSLHWSWRSALEYGSPAAMPWRRLRRRPGQHEPLIPNHFAGKFGCFRTLAVAEVGAGAVFSA